MKFISFMSSATSQVKIAKWNHTLPTLRSAQSAVSGEEFISQFLRIKQTGTVAAPQPIPQNGLFFDTFDPYIQEALGWREPGGPVLNAVADAWKLIAAWLIAGVVQGTGGPWLSRRGGVKA